MSSFTDLLAITGGFAMGLIVLGSLWAMGAGMLVWRRVRLVGMMAAVGLVMGMLSVHAAPPEKFVPQAPSSTGNEPKKTPLTKLMEEADKEIAKVDKGRQAGEPMKKEETPKERYIRLVRAQVEKKWNSCLRLRSDALFPGIVYVEFYINTDGKLDDIRVVNDKQSHLALTEVTLRAIMQAEIPPMPAEVIPSLPMNDPKRLKIEYSALISYAEPENSDTKGRKKAAVKEDKTAKGAYTQLVLAQVEKKWKAYREEKGVDVSAGSLWAEFYVNKLGRVENVRAVDVTKSSATLTGFTLRAIKDAEIPPMPADVIPLLPKDDPERLKIEYHALIEAGRPQEKNSAVVPGKVQDDAPDPRTQQTERLPKNARTRFAEQVQKIVHQTYEPYILRDGKGPGVFHITMAVDLNGKVGQVLVTDKMGNNEKLRALTQRLIYDAKLPPIPAEVIPLLSKNSPEHLKLAYDVIIH